MTQSERSADIPLPHIVTVAGLKKSGKTRVVEALIAGLSARGHRVGSVKTMEHAALSLDPEGTDTRRHADAGARVVVAVLAEEIVRFEHTSSPRSMQKIAGLFPPETTYLVCEGMLDRDTRQIIVVCLHSMDELDRTLESRSILRESVCAISGVAAAGLTAAGHASSGLLRQEGFPVFDVNDASQREALVDIVIGAAESLQVLKKACPDV